jgi:putative SOS response-associated peptidase YedK
MKEKPKVPHINAGAETVDKLSMFREAFGKRRYLIPATGFYEWENREDGKQPYRSRARTLSRSPLPGYASSPASAAKTSYRQQSS